MSAAQINAGMWGNYSPSAAQATQNNIYGAGGFGAQPAYYAGLGAAYGRATGGFGGYGAANADPFTAVPYRGGGIGSDAYRGGQEGNYQVDPFSGAISGYNAPRQYGWDANEGAPVPAQPSFNDIWSGRGAQSLARDNLFNVYTWPTPQPQRDFLDRWNTFPQQQSWSDPFSQGGGFGGGAAWATGTPAGTRSAVPDARTYMPSGQFGGYLDHYLWGANSGSLGANGIRTDPFGGYVPQGGGYQTDPFSGAITGYSGGGIGSDASYGGQNTIAGYGSALNALRAGQGWTIANTPQAAGQGYLANRINQSIYDIGNAGDYYGRSIGGGFGMNLPNQGQGTLTPQDLAIPHAYPPEVRAGGPGIYANDPFGGVR
jgi:hypothetical protein